MQIKITQREPMGASFGPRFVFSSILCLSSLIGLTQAAQATQRAAPVIQAEMLMQMEQMQQEIRTLRNLVEQQGHRYQQMQNDQRQRYVDLDQRLQDHASRLNELEELSLGSVPAAAPQAAPSATHQAELRQAAQDSSSTLNAREAYALAYALVPERRFNDAINAFNRFILDYPESRLVGNGYYWIGEIYMAQNRTQEAERMFDVVLRNHPDSFKLADSKYKLGVIYARYGDQRRARDMMRSIINDNPQEPVAALAQAFLDRASSQ